MLNVLKTFKTGKQVELHNDVTFDGVKAVFKSQSEIGWRIFIDGCGSVEWAKAQQIYLNWIGSRKSGKKWTSGLILQLWNVQWDAWMNRNEVLHDTPLAEIMGGGLYLDNALRKEWMEGFDLLPRSIASMIPEEVENVLNLGLQERKGWLVLVRRARVANGFECIQDEFSKASSKLREWVGL